MLEGLRRWWSGSGRAARGGDSLADWAESRHYSLRGVRDGDGFVVEGRAGAAPWRLEWGPAQRAYLQGHELRLRAELGLAPELQAMVITRALQEQLERTVFEQYVQGVQTRIDDQTPPEMRWLVMYPKLTGAELGPLRERFAALANAKPWLQQWIAGPLAAALAASKVAAAAPLVLTAGRGRLTLRTQLAHAEIALVDETVHLFETAMREARRAAAQTFDNGTPSTQPSLWSASALPPDTDRRS